MMSSAGARDSFRRHAARRGRVVGLWALLLLTACGGAPVESADDDEASTQPPRLAAHSAGDVRVQLNDAERTALDLLVTPLSAGRWGGTRELAGELVADPASLSTVRAAVSGRLVVDAPARWPGYGEAVAAGAELGVVGDARPLVAARSGRVTQVLAQPGELVQAGQPLLEITDLDHPVARLVWFGESGPQPPSAVELVPEGSGAVPARLMGPAAEADPVTRRPAFLYRAARPWSGARPGLPVRARFGGGAALLNGVVVPADAVVQWDGFAWVYVERERGRFARQRISTDRPLDGAWFVAEGLAPGDGVVVRGAQALLSEEFRARITVGDESDQ